MVNLHGDGAVASTLDCQSAGGSLSPCQNFCFNKTS